jgi:hypothetical protein
MARHLPGNLCRGLAGRGPRGADIRVTGRSDAPSLRHRTARRSSLLARACAQSWRQTDQLTDFCIRLRAHVSASSSTSVGDSRLSGRATDCAPSNSATLHQPNAIFP